MFKMLNAIFAPLPASPSRFSTGVFASERMSAVVEEPLMPILCSSAPFVSPSCRSTMKPENLSPSILAKTMNTSAKPPFVIHIFSPFKT